MSDFLIWWTRKGAPREDALKANPAFANRWENLMVPGNCTGIAFYYELAARLRGFYPYGKPFCELSEIGWGTLVQAWTDCGLMDLPWQGSEQSMPAIYVEGDRIAIPFGRYGWTEHLCVKTKTGEPSPRFAVDLNRSDNHLLHAMEARRTDLRLPPRMKSALKRLLSDLRNEYGIPAHAAIPAPRTGEARRPLSWKLLKDYDAAVKKSEGGKYVLNDRERALRSRARAVYQRLLYQSEYAVEYGERGWENPWEAALNDPIVRDCEKKATRD